MSRKAKKELTQKFAQSYQKAVRIYNEWDEKRPGFFEIDLVVHTQESARGEFCHTLCAVDVYSGWTEVFALKNRAQKWVFEALKEMRKILPFPLLGIDSDNGAEFINDHLRRFVYLKCIS